METVIPSKFSISPDFTECTNSIDVQCEDMSPKVLVALSMFAFHLVSISKKPQCFSDVATCCELSPAAGLHQCSCSQCKVRLK